MKRITTLFLFIFQSCIIGSSFHGFGNTDSARNRDRVHFNEKTNNFETIPNFRGNIIKLGDVVIDESENIDSNKKKKRICERNETELIKKIDFLDERTIVSIYETSSYLCIEYY
ncbi:hypothetical protein JWG41_05365 [Leptospira sp. 201903075]|uniref:hypothetical protein n=1 Tax=Leptospira chreensis TaxID=2810035 RepID=UPI0019640D22|nr:hypothetical protein [Leptospira chreensis]MBM9589864.1 hypothetical protein [Leptospira chreensis]